MDLGVFQVDLMLSTVTNLYIAARCMGKSYQQLDFNPNMISDGKHGDQVYHSTPSTTRNEALKNTHKVLWRVAQSFWWWWERCAGFAWPRTRASAQHMTHFLGADWTTTLAKSYQRFTTKLRSCIWHAEPMKRVPTSNSTNAAFLTMDVFRNRWPKTNCCARYLLNYLSNHGRAHTSTFSRCPDPAMFLNRRGKFHWLAWGPVLTSMFPVTLQGTRRYSIYMTPMDCMSSGVLTSCGQSNRIPNIVTHKWQLFNMPKSWATNYTLILNASHLGFEGNAATQNHMIACISICLYQMNCWWHPAKECPSLTISVPLEMPILTDQSVACLRNSLSGLMGWGGRTDNCPSRWHSPVFHCKDWACCATVQWW